MRLEETSMPPAAATEARRQGVLYATVKRLLDVLTAATLGLVCLPIGLLVGLAIRLDSRGPVLFRCRRVGLGGAEFSMLKFRKMRDGATGPALTVSGDARFTRIGRFLAKTKIDEMPQLWNVLRGEMSLVGPRPEDPVFVALRPKEFAPILTVKPGMTGLCQLAFANESRILDTDDRLGDYLARLLPQKMSIDRTYVARRSLLMDFGILAWTFVAVVLRRDVAVHRETGALSLRRRPTLPETERLSREQTGAA